MTIFLPPTIVIVIVMAVGHAPIATAGDMEEDRDILVEGVASIADPGVPGPLTVSGPEATVVVCGGIDRGSQEPVVAAVRWRRGPVVAFGLRGYFGTESLQTGDTAALVANGVRWASGKTPDQELRFGVVGKHDVLRKSLAQRGHEVFVSSYQSLEQLTADFDVICVDARAGQTPLLRDKVAKFVQKGGGLGRSQVD